jgi:hypothetical protein
MVKQKYGYLLALLVLLSSVSPITAKAEDLPENIVQQDIVITEVQTNGEGTGTTTHEYIELYNSGAEPVNMLGWTIVYINSSNKESTLYSFDKPFLFLPNTFAIGKLATSEATYLPDVLPDFTYKDGLAATAGGIQIKNVEGQIVDLLKWTSSQSYIDDVTITGLIGGKSAQRRCDNTQTIFTTDKPTQNYTVASVTPRLITCDSPIEQEDPEDNDTTDTDTDKIDQEIALPDIESTEPSQRIRLPIVLNELFIDPTTPLTDANDEYVELYNPNDIALDVSGYRIRVGATTKYMHSFALGTMIGAREYLVVSAKDSSVSLSNSGGIAEVYNDINEVVDSTTYEKAIPGASWARGTGDQWVWTIMPTLNSQNIIVAPAPIAPVATAKAKIIATKKKTTTSTRAKKKTNFSVALPIQINELYPDPKSPETDAKDEFIELYNPHSYAINITDYTVVVGTSKTYKYTFPEGSVIAPGGYVVVDSGTTNLSFSNNGTDVVLLNNFDAEIDKVTYEKAKQGMSYAQDDAGKWQWTITITKGYQNSISATTEITPDSTAVAGIVSGTDDTPLTPAPQPLPGWALAVLGVSAVCYAAYEYRFEARNTIYKLRANRTAG